MRILLLGDSYCPAAALSPAFAQLTDRHQIRSSDVVEEPDWTPVSPSESRLKEYMGSPAQVIAALRTDDDVLVVQGAPVTDAVLDAAPHLALVCCVRGGPVNVDLAAATARGIPVVTTPGKNADAVADLALAFMVMLARRLPEVLRHVEGGGTFGHDNYEGARWFGHNLLGRTLGLVGYGQVGRRVMLRARAFGMQVVVFDPYVSAETIAADGARAVDLDTLLDTADVLSLHARATDANRNLIGAAQLARMRPGGYLINTARETLLDEAALQAALASGHLAGVALDVVSPSPAEGRHPLLEFPNVIITAHVGGATHETLHNGAAMAAAEIERFVAGIPLVNVANRAGLAAGGATAVR